MFVDTHVHIFDPSFGRFAFPPEGSEYDRLISTKMLLEEAGDELASCVVVGCSDENELNARLLDTAENDPLVGAFIGQVDPRDPACVSYVKGYEKKRKYRGFRVNAEAALPYADNLSEAIKPGVIFELLGQWHRILPWKEYIAEHPDVQFVIQHFGCYAFDGKDVPEEYKSFCNVMAQLPNVVMKLSGMYTLCGIHPKPFDPKLFREAFRTALEAFGADRCMFGSDWPICGAPYPQIVKVTRALLDSEEEQKVLCSTARRVYSLGVYQKLRDLNINLVPVPPAAGAFATAVPFGKNLMYFSGAGPLQHNGCFDYIGRLGETMDLQQGYDAARSVGITLLSNMHAVLGDLNRVSKIVKVTGFVSSASDFYLQPKVINGFSELMLEVFGEKKGAHSRTAIGVASLPSGIPVEAEMLIEYDTNA